MQIHGGGEWAAAVGAYLASERGASTSAYAGKQLLAQDGRALGFSGARHGLDEVHTLRVWLESLAPPKVLAPLAECSGISAAHERAHLALWLMTGGNRTS